MPNRRMNKTIAGYHILMILSAVDFRFHINEERIIKEYLLQEFPFNVDIDKQMEIISHLKPEDWYLHFHKCIDDFADEATEQEKTDLLKFALHLTKADEIITVEENKYLQLLFEAFDFERE